MDNKVILVTGGAGFIGSNIVRRLWQDGAKKILVLDNLVSGRFKNISSMLGERVIFHKGDIRDFDLLLKLSIGVDIICHQAAWGSVPRSFENPRDYHENNVTGFLNILEAARINKIKRVVYASSSSVYGDDSNDSKKEGRQGIVLSPYGMSKWIDELYGEIYWRFYGIETIGLRYFNVFGPNQNPEGDYAAVIPKFIVSALKSEPLRVYGDGNQSRDFTFVDNVVDMNLLCFSTEVVEAFGRVFNVGCGERIVLNDFLSLLQKKYQLNVTYVEPRRGDIRDSLADISDSQRILGYEPRVFFEEGIKKTCGYFEIVS